MANKLDEIPALILAGGFGNRLRPVYDAGPKPLAPVAGRPFLAYLLHQLRSAGFRRVVLCVGYKAGQVQETIGNGSCFDLQVEYSVEPEPLGTGGALAFATRRLAPGERLFVMNGDSFCQLDFAAMLSAHLTWGAVATIALAAVADSSRYGSVEFDADRRVRAFVEKGAGSGSHINSGVYLFQPETFADVQAGRPVSLESEVLPGLVGKGLFAFPETGHFIDIGIPADFARAQVELNTFFSP